jgi:hypothetical protein
MCKYFPLGCGLKHSRCYVPVGTRKLQDRIEIGTIAAFCILIIELLFRKRKEKIH